MTVLTDAVYAAVPVADPWTAETSVSPSPSTSTGDQLLEQDQDQVGAGPGAFWTGFIAAVIILALAVDLVRRLRRMRYRQQARIELAREYGVEDEEFPDGAEVPPADEDPFAAAERRDREREERRTARAARRAARRSRQS